MRWSSSLFFLVIAAPVWAWPPNGARLTGAFDAQVGPLIVSDGAGGAFVAWTDQRDYFRVEPSSRNDAYIQRVTALGQIATGWPTDGLPIAAGPEHQTPMSVAPDGSGGVLVVIADTRFDNGDLYLHRITATGARATGWPAAGVPIATASGQQLFPELVSDEAGGAFVTWLDAPSPSSSTSRITHVLSSGEIAPGWPANGRLFEPHAQFVVRPLLLSTGDGGFLACWSEQDDISLGARLLARRFTAEGIPNPSWPTEAVVVCERRPNQRVPGDRLVPDGTGGFYVLFSDFRNSPPSAPYDDDDLFAQHVLGNGTIAPGWPADGMPIVVLPGIQQRPSLCEDGRGGVFLAWEDYRTGAARVFGQHLGADGQPHPGWPVMGKGLTGTPGFQLAPKLVWDSRDGAYMTWNNLQSGGYRSYVQHLRPDGTPAAGWPTHGLPVIPLVTDQYMPVITADGLGGAIVAWGDVRDMESDVYAQKFIGDGVVAAQVSVAEVEADANEVRIRWHVSGETRARVERREAAREWRILDELIADGSGYLRLYDRDVHPGTDYEYRLAFADGSHAGVVALRVPAAFILSLEGARPNPAVGEVLLAFTLPDASPARLELYDLSGRRLSSRDVGHHGAGRHVVRAIDGTLAPGLYWASLTHGGRTLRTRVAVVR
jgi:hypothetical protein